MTLTQFWGRVNKGADCWLWTAAQNGNGYGRLRFNGKNKYAHRVSYEDLVGPIPHGLELDHLCRNRLCVNPAHLDPVTTRTNILRGNGYSGRKHRQTHCVNGHELDDTNTYHTPEGRRQCRTCRRNWKLLFEQRRKQCL